MTKTVHQQFAFDFSDKAIDRLASSYLQDSLETAKEPYAPGSGSPSVMSGICSPPAILLRSAYSLQNHHQTVNSAQAKPVLLVIPQRCTEQAAVHTVKLRQQESTDPASRITHLASIAVREPSATSIQPYDASAFILSLDQTLCSPVPRLFKE